jgi:hypothetical protein
MFYRFRKSFIIAAVIIVVLSSLTVPVFAQQQMSAQPARAQNNPAEVRSLCNPNKLESASLDAKTTFTCQGKRPTPKSGAASKYKAANVGGARAEINCSYSESGSAMKWLGCTCKSDDDGNCTVFITWCAEQGDEVGGNSGSASCSPGG